MRKDMDTRIREAREELAALVLGLQIERGLSNPVMLRVLSEELATRTSQMVREARAREEASRP